MGAISQPWSVPLETWVDITLGSILGLYGCWNLSWGFEAIFGAWSVAFIPSLLKSLLWFKNGEAPDDGQESVFIQQMMHRTWPGRIGQKTWGTFNLHINGYVETAHTLFLGEKFMIFGYRWKGMALPMLSFDPLHFKSEFQAISFPKLVCATSSLLCNSINRSHWECGMFLSFLFVSDWVWRRMGLFLLINTLIPYHCVVIDN